MAKSTAILAPNYGLYLGRPSITIPARGLEDGNNFRVREGKLSSFNMGWIKFDAQVLVGPVTLITEFVKSDASRVLIVGTPEDLYRWDTGTSSYVFINEQYDTGTASRSGSTVTGAGGAAFVTNNVKIGDYIHFGTANQNDPSVTWHEITNVGGETTLTTATSGTVGSGAYTIRRTFRGNAEARGNFWSSVTFPRAQIAVETFEDRWYAVNAIDAIVEWDGSAATVTALDIVDTARFLKLFKNMLIIGAPTMSGEFKPFTILNSDVGQPTVLDSGLAGEYIAAPGNNPLQTAEPLGDDLILYTDREVITMTFTGAPTNFAFRTAIPDTGVMGPRLVANMGDSHQYLSYDGLYSFNGVVSPQRDQHIWTAVLQSRDPGRQENSFAAFDVENGELYWAVALTTDSTPAPSRAYTQHYLELVPEGVPTPYSKRDFPFTCLGSFLRTDQLTWDEVVGDWTAQQFAWNDKFLAADFPLVLVGSEAGLVYTLNSADSQDGVAYPAYVTFGRRLIGDIRHRNLLSRVYLMMDPNPTGAFSLIVTTTVYDHAAATPGSSTVLNFDLTLAGEQFVSPFRVGRYAQVQVGSLGSVDGQPWRIFGYDWDVVPGGMK